MAQKIYRLAIGSQHGRRSGTWRMWSNPKGDIYVAVRCLGGIYKEMGSSLLLTHVR